MKTQNSSHKCLTASLLAWAALAGHHRLSAATMDFKDWTVTGSGHAAQVTNLSSAGTITGSKICPSGGCWGYSPGTIGVATAITPQQFSTEFSAAKPGTAMDFIFSVGYDWGTGGQLLLGNIHNYFEYRISAWDFVGNEIDVNTWTTPTGLLTEYPDGSPGQLGYFSTSSTTRCAGTSTINLPPGQSSCPGTANTSDFFVADAGTPGAGLENFGQGGVLALGGLLNVGRIQVTLVSNSLATNGQGSDFFLFNVATPVPEPSSAVLSVSAATAGGLVLLLRRRRKGCKQG